jgi:TP901-1 family phage major tail protein
MGAQKGKDLVLRMDPDGAGSFVTVAGLRSRRLSFNADTVEITDTESAGRWRELLDGAGVKRADISGAGIFKDAASDAAVRETFFDGRIATWQVVIPGFGTVEGPFQVTALEYGGTHDGEVVYEIAMESAGALAFTAGA